MTEMGEACNIFVGEPEGTNGWTLSKWILKQDGVRMWDGFS
jgi:hypothetical protein